MADRLQQGGHQGVQLALWQHRRLQHHLHVVKQFRALADGFQYHCATAGMAVDADVVGGRQIGQGLHQDAGIVLDGGFRVLDWHLPLRVFRRHAVDRDVVVAAGQQDQFGGGLFVGLGEVAVVFQKAMNANDGLFRLAAVIPY